MKLKKGFGNIKEISPYKSELLQIESIRKKAKEEMRKGLLEFINKIQGTGDWNRLKIQIIDYLNK